MAEAFCNNAVEVPRMKSRFSDSILLFKSIGKLIPVVVWYFFWRIVCGAHQWLQSVCPSVFPSRCNLLMLVQNLVVICFQQDYHDSMVRDYAWLITLARDFMFVIFMWLSWFFVIYLQYLECNHVICLRFTEHDDGNVIMSSLHKQEHVA